MIEVVKEIIVNDSCGDMSRKRPGGRARMPEATRKLNRKQNGVTKLAHEEVLSLSLSLSLLCLCIYYMYVYLRYHHMPSALAVYEAQLSEPGSFLLLFMTLQNVPVQPQIVHKINGHCGSRTEEGDIVLGLEPTKPSIDIKEETSHVKNASQGDVPFSGPLQVSGSSGFAWAKRRIDDISIRSRSRSSSRSLIFEPAMQLRNNLDPKRNGNCDTLNMNRSNSRGHDSRLNHVTVKDWSQLENPNSFDASSDAYHSQELSLSLYQKEDAAIKRISLVSSHFEL